MSEQIMEKEKLLTSLSEIYEQLEELEIVLEASFSDLRNSLRQEEQIEIRKIEKRIIGLEKKYLKNYSCDAGHVSSLNKTPKQLKVELGF